VSNNSTPLITGTSVLLCALLVGAVHGAPVVAISHRGDVQIYVDRLGSSDNPEGWQNAIDMGASGIQTDRPAELAGDLRPHLLALAVPLARVQAGVPPASSTAPAFDVVSIHQTNTATDGHHHIYNNPSESHFRTVNLSAKDLIQFAYGLPKAQIVGGPAWLDSTMFDIDAKSDPAIDAQLRNLPSDQARQQKQLMVQAVLANRFQFAAHQEIRALPVYALVVAKGGPKFQPSQTNGTIIDTGRSRLHIAGTDDTVAVLAREVAQVVGRVVLNHTGISGRYDLTLKWTPDDTTVPAFNQAPDANAPPGIFTAIEEQLGLKLESSKGPVTVLIIDHVEPPSAN
jgi:uncharacterized protein (TIGR03435 family)